MTALKNDNYFETIELLTNEQREAIKNNKKDYIVLDVREDEIKLSLTNQFPTKKCHVKNVILKNYAIVKQKDILIQFKN